MKRKNYQSPTLEMMGIEAEDVIMAFSAGGTPSYTPPGGEFNPGF